MGEAAKLAVTVALFVARFRDDEALSVRRPVRRYIATLFVLLDCLANALPLLAGHGDRGASARKK